MLFVTIMHHAAADAQPSRVCGPDNTAQAPATLLPVHKGFLQDCCQIQTKPSAPRDLAGFSVMAQ